MDMTSLLGLMAFIGLCFLTALSGAFFMPGEWYRGLAKPSWNPPDWAFAPAWTVLYIMIAVSGWMVWREAGIAGAALPLAVYVVQLLFNAGWSAVFFGMQRPDRGDRAVAVDPGDDHRLLAGEHDGGAAAAALSRLGELRRDLELRHLAVESDVARMPRGPRPCLGPGARSATAPGPSAAPGAPVHGAQAKPPEAAPGA